VVNELVFADRLLIFEQLLTINGQLYRRGEGRKKFIAESGLWNFSVEEVEIPLIFNHNQPTKNN
jgi:hypothetical protein